MVQCPRVGPSRVNVNPVSEGSGEGVVLGAQGGASLWTGLSSWSCDLQMKDVARPWVYSKAGGSEQTE